MAERQLHVVLVEDDHIQAETNRALIGSWTMVSRVSVVSTESEFRAKLDGGRWDSAADRWVFVIDLMLRWCDSRPDMPPPTQDVVDGGYYRAGLRCAERLRMRYRDRTLAITLVTVLPIESLGKPPRGSSYLPKEDHLNKLRQWMERVSQTR